MNRASRLRLRRLLAALLWLAASFAYLTRDQQMAGMSGMAMAVGVQGGQVQQQEYGQDVQYSQHNQHHQTASGTHHPVQSVHENSEHASPDHLKPDANAPPTQQNHAGHCPFCFTAAFALEGVTVGVSLAHSNQAEQTTAERLAAPRVSAFHEDARAPPFWV